MMNGRVINAYRSNGYQIDTDERCDYFLGLDLGQSNDPTALCIVEREWRSPHQKSLGAKGIIMNCRHLERIPLRSSYTDIVKYAAKRVRDLEGTGKHVYLIIDATGVGRPVCDMFDEAGLPVTALTMTGGHDVTKGENANAVNVPKRDLISALQRSLQMNTLRIAKELKYAKTLKHELGMFKIKIGLKGNVSLEAWREKDHDDLVLAASMAVWAATYERFYRYTDEGGAVVFGTISFPR